MKVLGTIDGFVAFGQNFGTVKVVQNRHTYQDGTQVVDVMCYDSGYEEVFGRLTVCYPGVNLKAGEFLVKTWGENEEWVSRILKAGLFEDTGQRVGYCQAQIWRLK